MGECLIVRREVDGVKPPSLDANYPSDVIVMESATASASFNVVLTENDPDVTYIYQWYLNGSPVSGATSSIYTVTGLTSEATHSVFCIVSNKAGSTTSKTAILTVAGTKPIYTYTGSSTLVDDGNYNWRIKFFDSGTLRFSYLGNSGGTIQLFMLGGGGGGGYHNTKYHGAGGGGGGRTKTTTANIAINTDYTITVGAGGGCGGAGGASSAFGQSISGGSTGSTAQGGAGGSGGGGGGWSDGAAGGAGGSNGGGGGTGYTNSGGSGQGTTTREFGESSGTLYAGGGGGGAGKAAKGQVGTNGSGGSGGGAAGQSSASANTGGGGGGGRAAGYNEGYSVGGGSGGSGIVVIRNRR